MKKLLGLALVTCAFVISSCSATRPIAATSNPVGNKCGTASQTQILMMGGSSNMGINKAAKNGGITRISHIDYKTQNFLFVLWRKNTILVYGE